MRSSWFTAASQQCVYKFVCYSAPSDFSSYRSGCLRTQSSEMLLKAEHDSIQMFKTADMNECSRENAEVAGVVQDKLQEE